LQADKDELTSIQAEQQKLLDEASTAIENSQLLIAEYKDKNDYGTGDKVLRLR
jgi:iron uptake system EfeUOB component EfeO/EfeM